MDFTFKDVEKIDFFSGKSQSFLLELLSFLKIYDKEQE